MKLASAKLVGGASRHRETLRFLARPGQVAVCRREVLAVLRAWSTLVQLEDVELLLSEIVTNAILYGTATDAAVAWVRVELDETEQGLLVRVQNEGSQWRPEAGEPADLMESGRGLLLVEELAETWGHECTEDGTTVHFLIRYLDTLPGGPRAVAERSGIGPETRPATTGEMSRPCDIPTIPSRRSSSHDVRSTWPTRSSPGISERATGSACAARPYRARWRSAAQRFSASTRANWPSSALLLPTPSRSQSLLSRNSFRRRSISIGCRTGGRSAGAGRVAPGTPHAMARRPQTSDCLLLALYWGRSGTGSIGGLGGRIPRPAASREQRRQRASTTSVGSWT